MISETRQKLRKKHNDAANGEIKKLQESIERLSLGRTVSLRVRYQLRIYEHAWRKASILTRMYGMICGLWTLMPFIVALDDRPGSMRSVLAALFSSGRLTLSHAANSADLVTGILRIALGIALAAAYYTLWSVGPIILSVRVGLGFAGVRAPGRKTILSCRKAAPVYFAYTVLESCADAIGRNGEQRAAALHRAATQLGYLRRSLGLVHRFTPGFTRRHRRRSIRLHVAKVDVYLATQEQSIDDMTDMELKKLGDVILSLAEHCAYSQYGNLIDREKIADIIVPDRESIRIALTALAAITGSAASLYLIDLFKLPSTLEPLAISSSVLISALVGYGKKAAGKIATIRGMIGQ